MTMRDAQVRKRGGISALLNRYGIELVFVILFVYGCFGSKNFFTLSNQVSVLRQISITAPIAIAMTFVIINGTSISASEELWGFPAWWRSLWIHRGCRCL